MPRHAMAFLVLCILGATYSSRATFAQQASEPNAPRARANNDETYLKLRNIRVGPEHIGVGKFVIKRDAGVFTFNGGTFYLLEPVNGKITGAVFLGEATFALTPPLRIEQKNLAILTKGQPFEEQFSTAVFRFTDGTENEIRKAAVESAGPGGDPNGPLGDVHQQLKKKLKYNLAARLLEDVLSSAPGGKFIAFIKGKKYGDKIVYDVDPHGAIEVSSEEVSLTLWDDNREGVWAGFHLAQEYVAHTANSAELNQAVRIVHQNIDATIAKSAHLTASAKTTIVSAQSGVRVVPFDLFPTLRVDSVTGQGGEPLSFIQEDKNEDADFAVILPQELQKGQEYTIVTRYDGKDAISNEGGGNYYPISRENWYPSQGFGNYTTYDLTFHVPKKMTMVATGKLVKSTEEGDASVTVWTTEVPQAVAGFNFGNFKRAEGKPLKQPYLLETYANPNPPDIVTSLLHSNVIPSPGTTTSENEVMGSMSTVGMMKKAMAEAQLSVDLYTDFFGEAPYKHLAMTQQTAPNYGQSWPGLVYLPLTYFFDSTIRHQIGFDDAYGYFKVVGPHEIAHQWWGHMVGFNSYRDQWMSEGFSDMSASLFLQYFYGQKGLDEYHKFWADQRRFMTQKNRYGYRAIDVGPVIMGARLNSAKTGTNVYQDLIYPKGAYILQMVRFMLTDTHSNDPDVRFKALMHDFTKTYANRVASTEDFKAMLEKYMTPEMDSAQNHKMDWFFNDYVYGTEYPSYKFEHSFSNDADGNVVLNFKLTQADVSQDFVMLVPIYLDLGNGHIGRVGSARLVGSSTMEQHVPLKGLREKPKRAMIAYYDDVLGNIDSK